MDSAFGELFLFLTDLAWKSRLTIPILVTTAFLVMDIRLQIEINIQSGQVNATDMEDDDVYQDESDDMDGSFSSEYTNDDEDENGNLFGDYESESDAEELENVNHVIRPLHIR